MPSSASDGARLHRCEIGIANSTRGTVLGSHIHVAENALSRAVGLLAHCGLDPGGGLLLDPSSGVHTFFMRFPIDVVALDRQLRVRALWENLVPFRCTTLSWKTSCVLELPAGVVRESGTEVGDQLVIRKSTAEAAASAQIQAKLSTGAAGESIVVIGMAEKEKGEP
jgi:uncharacterized membrane protein (UPF0127 family)